MLKQPVITEIRAKCLAFRLVNELTGFSDIQRLNLIRQKAQNEPIQALIELSEIIKNLRINRIREGE